MIIDDIKPIKNKGGSLSKPIGGLWASPINSKYGWIDWCKDEEYCLDSFDVNFQFTISGKIIKIDSKCDLNLLNWVPVYKSSSICRPDYEALYYSGIDAVWLTENGQNETRFSQPHSLYGWDCESVLIMNSACIR